MIRGFAVFGLVVVCAAGVFAEGVTSRTGTARPSTGLSLGSSVPEKVPVSGRVTDESGKPVSSAVITYFGYFNPRGVSSRRGIIGWYFSAGF